MATWFDRADELRKLMPGDEDARIAWDAFCQAADLRKTATAAPASRRKLLNDAARHHRLGVKHYKLALAKN